MFDQIFEYLKANIGTIKKNPILILLVSLLAGYLGWYLNGLRYDGIIKNKDAVIDTKDAQIEQLKSSRATMKTLIFDVNGKVLLNMGAENLIDSFEVKKQGTWDTVIVELQTKEHLAHIPTILSISGSFLVGWDTVKRAGENTIIWTGHYIMYDDEMVPKFKMEIYHKD